MTRISLDAWQAGGDTQFQHRGQAVFTRTGGRADGPVLLLIHGFPTASWDWEGVWDGLAPHYRLLTLDLMGFGFSAKPVDYAYSILDQADLCEALLRNHGVRDYHVLAHDYGDTVAQELLARQGDGGANPGGHPRLLSLALLNGGLFPETHRPRLIQRLLLSPLGPWVAARTSRAKLAATLRNIFGPGTPPDDELVDSFWRLLQHHRGQRVMHLLIHYMPERRRHRARWVGALQNARIPLKLINGPADPISGAHMVARYRELVPRPDVTLLPGIGHYPQCEAPAAVLAAYLEFRTSAA
jgi:pimeloyl-ACP methyl ester carboxylesterase